MRETCKAAMNWPLFFHGLSKQCDPSANHSHFGQTSTAKKAEVTVKDIYWTLGQYDLVSILEAADDEQATAVGLSVCSLGNVRTQTLRAFSAEEIGRIIAKMP